MYFKTATINVYSKLKVRASLLIVSSRVDNLIINLLSFPSQYPWNWGADIKLPIKERNLLKAVQRREKEMMSSTCYIRTYTPNTWQSIKVWKNCQISNYPFTHFWGIKTLQAERFCKHSDCVFLSWMKYVCKHSKKHTLKICVKNSMITYEKQ